MCMHACGTGIPRTGIPGGRATNAHAQYNGVCSCILRAVSVSVSLVFASRPDSSTESFISYLTDHKYSLTEYVKSSKTRDARIVREVV